MSNSFLLKNIEGNDPVVDFETVIKGASEIYDFAIPCFLNWLPQTDRKHLDFKSSQFKHAVEKLYEYVCLHQYTYSNDENENQIDTIPYYLITYVSTVYELWRWQIASIGQIFNEVTKPIRYFSIFAQAAKLRFQVDFGFLSEFRTREQEFEDNCYFTRNELGLLTSIIFDNNDVDRTALRYDLKTLPEVSKIPKVGSIFYPEHIDFNFYVKGRSSGNSPALVEHTEALKWLKNNYVPYNFTKYIRN